MAKGDTGCFGGKTTHGEQDRARHWGIVITVEIVKCPPELTFNHCEYQLQQPQTTAAATATTTTTTTTFTGANCSMIHPTHLPTMRSQHVFELQSVELPLLFANARRTCERASERANDRPTDCSWKSSKIAGMIFPRFLIALAVLERTWPLSAFFAVRS